MTTRPVVQAEALGKTYPEAGRQHAVLDGVNLEIAEGEFVVVIGRSGSGKSTLLNLVGAMDRPDSGRLTVAGMRIDTLDEQARTTFRRRHIGFVFQAYNLIPTLTVRENLRLPLALNRVAPATQDERVLDCLERLGLADRADSFPDALSGGEQQRIAVARALVHTPELIIADEPTGNLDLETGRQVLDLLDGMTRRAGRSLLMATHSHEVIGLADRVLQIAGGRLEAA